MSTDYSKVEQQIATSINKLKGEKLQLFKIENN